VIRGDHATARAFGADAAKLFELKRGQPTRVEAYNTVSAIEAVAKGEVEAAVSARGADPENPLEAELKFTPVAWDALALVVFPSNPVRSLSAEQLHDVMTGKIKDWSALGGKPGAINLYAVAGPFDGVEFALRRLVLGNGRAGTAAQRWYVNTVQLEAAVAIDPMGLGVSLLSDVADNKELRVIAIDDVAPSTATIASGAYALSAPLYAVTRATPSTNAARFLDWLAEADVQKQLRARRLVPANEAMELAANASTRESLLASKLGLNLARAVAVALPPPTPPLKTTPRNTARFAAATLILEALPALAAPAKPAADLARPAEAAAQAVKETACVEQPLC
jgi:phosphate transport system substrate-binding protein